MEAGYAPFKTRRHSWSFLTLPCLESRWSSLESSRINAIRLGALKPFVNIQVSAARQQFYVWSGLTSFFLNNTKQNYYHLVALLRQADGRKTIQHILHIYSHLSHLSHSKKDSHTYHTHTPFTGYVCWKEKKTSKKGRVGGLWYPKHLNATHT